MPLEPKSPQDRQAREQHMRKLPWPPLFEQHTAMQRAQQQWLHQDSAYHQAPPTSTTATGYNIDTEEDTQADCCAATQYPCPWRGQQCDTTKPNFPCADCEASKYLRCMQQLLFPNAPQEANSCEPATQPAPRPQQRQLSGTAVPPSAHRSLHQGVHASWPHTGGAMWVQLGNVQSPHQTSRL